jgi:hypothetical protein
MIARSVGKQQARMETTVLCGCIGKNMQGNKLVTAGL